jgi:hypothetical protein
MAKKLIKSDLHEALSLCNGAPMCYKNSNDN